MKLCLAKIILEAPAGWTVRMLGKQLVFLSPHGMYPHREIVFTLRKDGGLLYKDYYEAGIFHRDDGPAVTIYCESGEVSEELFYNHGKIVERKFYGDEIK